MSRPSAAGKFLQLGAEGMALGSTFHGVPLQGHIISEPGFDVQTPTVPAHGAQCPFQFARSFKPAFPIQVSQWRQRNRGRRPQRNAVVEAAFMGVRFVGRLNTHPEDQSVQSASENKSVHCRELVSN